MGVAMRWSQSVPKLTVAAAALLAVLAVPGAAAGEPAASCLAQLNAVRHLVGSPRVTASRPLAIAAARHAAYRARTDAAGLRDLSAHHETRGRPGFSGRLPWDRTAAAGLPAGAWLAQGEDAITGVGVRSLAGVRAWTDAPYHRLPLLDPNMTRAGCGAASHAARGRSWSAEVLDMAWPRQRQVARLVPYPAADQTRVPRVFDRRSESPSPFPRATSPTVGYVVTLQASGWQALEVSRMTLAARGARVSAYLATGSASPGSGATADRSLPGNAVMLAARAPLAARTRYTVQLSGHVRAGPAAAWRPFRRTWSFTTA
jgi:uncharacterized protein YkwD